MRKRDPEIQKHIESVPMGHEVGHDGKFGWAIFARRKQAVRAMFIATAWPVFMATLLSLSACAQSHTPTSPLPNSPNPAPLPESPLTIAKDDRMTDVPPSFSEPMQTANDLRDTLLSLISEGKSWTTIEPRTVASALNVQLDKLPQYSDAFGASGRTADGWLYRFSVERLSSQDASYSFDAWMGQDRSGMEEGPNELCTLSFEDLSRRIVALGYTRSTESMRMGPRTRWGFSFDDAGSNRRVVVPVDVYRWEDATGTEQWCVMGVGLGVTSIHE
jgi:hypothetical protein